jgi:hypothetical protein
MLNKEIGDTEGENKYVVLIRKPGNVLLTCPTLQHSTFLILCQKATSTFPDRRDGVLEVKLKKEFYTFCVRSFTRKKMPDIQGVYKRMVRF